LIDGKSVRRFKASEVERLAIAASAPADVT
jgi:hypothetical protein